MRDVRGTLILGDVTSLDTQNVGAYSFYAYVAGLLMLSLLLLLLLLQRDRDAVCSVRSG